MQIRKPININPAGFTLIELMVTMSISLIVIFGISIYIVDMQRGYGKMYKRVHGGIVSDAYVARKAFEGLSRKAARVYTVGAIGTTIELDFWQNYIGQMPLDCHAKFYVDIDTQGPVSPGDPMTYALFLDSGPVGNPTTSILAHNVTDCAFYRTGNSVQMILTLDDLGDDRDPVTIFSTAVQHN